MAGANDFYDLVNKKLKEDEQPAQSGGAASFYALVNSKLKEEDEQTPGAASASDYDALALPPVYTPTAGRYGSTGTPAAKSAGSLALPTPEEWANRIVGEVKAANPWMPAATTPTQTVGTGKGTVAPGTPGGGGRGRKTEEELRKEQREAAAYARAVQPTSDMYLHPVTAAAAEEQQKRADEAGARAEERAKQAEASKSETEKQREKVKEAERLAAALQPTSDMYLHPVTAAAAEEQQKQADAAWERREEENRKLHEMGGRYGLAEDAQTVAENLGAGALSAVRGIGNALNYAGQEMTRGQLMEQQSVMSGLPGQQKIADSSGKLLEDMQQRGLQSIEQTADTLGLTGISKAGKWVQDFAQTAAEHSAASGKVTRAFAQTANGVGGMVPSILSNIAVPGSGLWIMAAQAAGNATEEALKAGAKDELAVIYGGAVAAVEVLTEKMFGGIPGLNIGSLDKGIENIVKRQIGSEAAQRAILFLVDALGEGAEEFISEFADWGLNQWLVGSDERTLRQVHKDAWYSALIGALTSVAMSGPVEAIKAAGPRRLARQVAKEMGERLEIEERTEKLKLPTPESLSQNENAAPDGTAEDLALPAPGESAGNQNAARNGTAESLEMQEADKNVSKADAKELIQKLQNSRTELEGEPTVATLTGTEFQKAGGKLTDQVGAFFKKLGNLVHRSGLGDVIIDTRGVKSDIAHGIGRAKAATFAAVPSVIEQGKQIDFQTNWKGRGYDSYVFAAPIDMAGKKRYLAAVVLSDQNNRFYLHEVIDEDGNLIYKIETPADIKTGVTAQDGVTGAAEVSTDTVPQSAQEVKTGLELPAVPVQEQAEMVERDLSLPAVQTEQAGSQAAEVRTLPTPEEWANRNDTQREKDLAELEELRREESLEEEQARREAEAEEYRRARAEEEAEEAAARAEREGKQMERTAPPKAPKSRAALKTRIQQVFSIQEGSKARVNEIVDVIADKIQNGQDIPAEMTERLFDALYEKGSYTQQADEYYRNFRETVKGSKIYVSPEVRAEFGEDWKALASRARRAGLILTNDINDGGVDIHAGELAEIYRQLDTEAHPAQQLEQIVDFAERGGPQTLTQAEMEDVLRGEYGDEAVQARMDEMERGFRAALELFKESAATETEVRAAADAKIQKAQKTASALAKRQMERKALRELQDKTLKQLQWLSKNRNRTDSEMRARFDDVLRNIDTIAVNAANALHTDNATGMTWRDLADLYKKAKESDPNFMPSKRLDDIVMRLDGEKIGDMDYNALQDLYKAAVGLRTEYYNRNNVINDELGRTFADAYHDSVDEFKAVKGNKDGETKASKWFNREQLTPANYLRRLVGWKKGSTFASFGKQLEEGERGFKKYVTDAAKALAEFTEKNADWVRRADGQGKDAIWYEYEVPELVELRMGDKPIYGDTVKVYMTPAQKVHLALEAENYDNLRHMEGGRTFPDKELYSKGKRAAAFRSGTTIKMSPEWAKKISSDLTPEEKALKDALSKYYNEYSKKEINRVSNVLYGYDRAMSGKYAPIFTNENYVGHQAGITDTTAEGVGHLKARQYSKNPSYNIGAFDAFARHTDQTARFVGYSIPIRNVETLMNWRGKDTSLRDEIDHKWKGADANGYIDDLLTNLQTTRYNEEGAVEGLTNQLLSKYITAVFGANPGIVLKQAASFPQAGAILGFDTLPKPKQLLSVDRGLIGKYTPELDYRQLGYATPETAQLKDNPGIVQRNKALNFLFGGGAITAMDGLTVQSIWPWAENYVSKHFPELQKGTQEQIDAGESPYYRKVAEMFNEAVSTTQPMYDTMHRAKIMQDGNGITRAFTMFKTVPLQQYNTLRQAFGELQAAKESGDPAERKAAARKTANAITATLGSVAALEGVELLNQLWKNGAKGYRDDDDELTAESAGKKLAERSIKDLAGMVIGGSELSDFIFNKINGKKWYGIEIPGGEQLNDIVEAFSAAGGAATDFVKNGVNILRNGGDLADYYRAHGAEYARALKDAAENLAMYVKGLPVQNVEKYLGGALRIAAPELYAQIGDFFETPDRAILEKTDDKLLPTRMRDALEQRMDGVVPQETADELARLYQKYGGSMALPDVPTSITIGSGDDSETLKLDAYQQQTYERAFRSALRSVLNGVGTDKEYLALDDDERADYLRKLYAVAGDVAKRTVSDEYAGTYADKVMNMRRAGASVPSIMRAFAMKAALSPAEFAAWVEDDRFHGDALRAVKEELDVSSLYDTLKATGLQDGEIFTVADAVDGIMGEKNKWKKLETIAGLDLPPESIDKAASAFMTESQYKGYQASGMELGEYVEGLKVGAKEDGKKIDVIRGVDTLDLDESKKLTLLDSMGYDVDGYQKVKGFMSLTDYADAMEIDAEAKGKKVNGETVSGSKKLEVMQGVNKMDLTPKQKTQIMEALGYKVDEPPIWDTDYTGRDYEAYYYMSDSQRATYEKYCDWMDVGDYAKYSESLADFHNINNDSGKTVVSRKKQVIEYIDALPLLDDQKTALYVAAGYNSNLTDKGFADCPWWNRLALRTEYYPS